MKITIELDEELKPAIELHLAKGISVHDYVRTALNFFNKVVKLEAEGCPIGYCSPSNKDNFERYNKPLAPTKELGVL